MNKNLLLLLSIAAGLYFWHRSRQKTADTGVTATEAASTESQVAAMISADSGVA